LIVRVRSIRQTVDDGPHRHHSKILILDFGAQYTQLIARRLRETHVYCEIHPYDVGDDFIRAFAPKGIVLSGGPNSVTEGDTPRAPDAVWSLGVPVLGICYGMQTMAAQLGGGRAGRCANSVTRRFAPRGHSTLFRGIEDRTNEEGHGLLDVWMSHGDKVTVDATGASPHRQQRRMRHRRNGRRVSATSTPCQFHPEVTHTDRGAAILARFAHEICGLRRRLEHGRITCRSDRRHPRSRSGPTK
jgi:GMP synthase (glutamine-hydrolysing)